RPVLALRCGMSSRTVCLLVALTVSLGGAGAEPRISSAGPGSQGSFAAVAILLGSDAFGSGGEAAAIEAQGDVQRQSVDAPSLGTGAGVINLEVVNELVEVDLPSGERQAVYVTWAYSPESQLVHWSLRYPTPYDPPDRLAEIGSRIRYFASTQEIVRVE